MDLQETEHSLSRKLSSTVRLRAQHNDKDKELRHLQLAGGCIRSLPMLSGL